MFDRRSDHVQVLMTRPREEWRNDVSARYKVLEHFSKEDARLQFLRILRSLPYGAHPLTHPGVLGRFASYLEILILILRAEERHRKCFAAINVGLYGFHGHDWELASHLGRSRNETWS